MNIAEVLAQHARQFPRRIALIEKAGSTHIELSYAELEHQARQTASLLLQRGLQRGERVLILLPMSLQLYITLLACFRLGLVACFVEPGIRRQHLEQCCEIAQPKAIIATYRGHWLRLLSPAIRAIPRKFHLRGWLPGSRSLHKRQKLHPSPELARVKEETALLTFSSGTTGQPKATARSHAFLLAQHHALAESLHHHADETDFTTLPIFVLANLASGMSTLLPDADLSKPDTVNVAHLCQQILKYQPQRLTMSPGFLQRIVDHCIEQQVHLSFPLHIFIGGGPVFPSLLQRVHAIATKVEITSVYGANEAEPIAHITFEGMDQDDLDAMTHGKGLLVGMPEKGLQLQIANSSDDPTQPGEIQLRGQHVLSGYITELEHVPTLLQGDASPWFRTGDCGYLDAQGRIWLLGRCQSRVRDRRGEFYPFSVECAAMSYPHVERAACIGEQDQRLLFIQGKEINKADILALEHALKWAQLDEIRQVSQIPLEPTLRNQVDYPALQKMF